MRPSFLTACNQSAAHRSEESSSSCRLHFFSFFCLLCRGRNICHQKCRRQQERKSPAPHTKTITHSELFFHSYLALWGKRIARCVTTRVCAKLLCCVDYFACDALSRLTNSR